MNTSVTTTRAYTYVLFALALVLGSSQNSFAQPATCITQTPVEQADVTIPDNSPFAGGTVTFDYTGSGIAVVGDVYVNMAVNHTWVGDLKMDLVSPSTGVVIMDRPGTNPREGNSSANLDGTPITFSDAYHMDAYTVGHGLTDSQNACTDNGMCQFNTDKPLTGIDGANGDGMWSVNIYDWAIGNSGFIDVSQFFLIVCPVGLPVELSSFEAETQGKQVLLRWTTASEENNSGFEVQRSGIRGWKSMGFVDGAGTTTETQAYSFTVSDFEFGVNSYRLKQVDFDGQFEFSETIEITRDVVDGFGLNAFYPNPFNPSGSFSLVVSEDQEISVDVYNVTGKKVKSLFSGSVKADQQQRFEFAADSSFPSGNYLIQINGEFFSTNTVVSLVK